MFHNLKCCTSNCFLQIGVVYSVSSLLFDILVCRSSLRPLCRRSESSVSTSAWTLSSAGAVVPRYPGSRVCRPLSHFQRGFNRLFKSDTHPGQLSNREKTDVQHQQWWWGQRRNKPPASSNMVFKTSWQPWSVTVWPLTFLGGGFICSSARTGARKKAFPGWGNGYSNPLTVTNIKSKFPQLVLTWCRRSSRVKKTPSL